MTATGSGWGTTTSRSAWPSDRSRSQAISAPCSVCCPPSSLLSPATRPTSRPSTERTFSVSGSSIQRSHEGGTMSQYLSQEWLDEFVTLAADQPNRPGATVKIQYKVTGGPGGDIDYYWVIDEGKILEAKLGTID